MARDCKSGGFQCDREKLRYYAASLPSRSLAVAQTFDIKLSFHLAMKFVSKIAFFMAKLSLTGFLLLHALTPIRKKAVTKQKF